MIKTLIFMCFFVAFAIGGIIGEEIEENKKYKLCYKIIKILCYFGLSYGLITILLLSMFN